MLLLLECLLDSLALISSCLDRPSAGSLIGDVPDPGVVVDSVVDVDVRFTCILSASVAAVLPRPPPGVHFGQASAAPDAAVG